MAAKRGQDGRRGRKVGTTRTRRGAAKHLFGTRCGAAVASLENVEQSSSILSGGGGRRGRGRGAALYTRRREEGEGRGGRPRANMELTSISSLGDERKIA